MCVAVPGRILDVAPGATGTMATVDFGSTSRQVDLVFVPEAGPGDWVITHSGYAVRMISADEARETIDLLTSIDPEQVAGD